MDEQVIRGASWTFLSYAGSKVVTVVTTVVLARILTPADFGVMALALVAITLFSFLKDMGLNAALVVHQDFDRRAQGTVLTLTLLSGVVLATLLAILAPLLARFFDSPRLDEILLVLALAVPLNSFGWFYEMLLQRELEFRRRFVAVGIQSAVYATLAIGLAALGAGVWSLVVAYVVCVAALALACVALAPYSVRPTMDHEAARTAFRTGTGFLAQSASGFLQENLDYVVIGRVLNTAQVGFYTMSYRMAEVPYLAIADSVSKVTFPGFARMRSQGADPAPIFLRTLQLVALVGCPLGVVLSGAAEPFVRTLFGEKWLPMIGPLSVLGIWAAARVLQGTLGWFLNSIGEAGAVGSISVTLLVPLLPALIVAANISGITAVAWVMLAQVLALIVPLSLLGARRGGATLRAQLVAVRPIILACVPAWLAARVLSETCDAIAPVAGLALAAAAGVGAFGLSVAILDRQVLVNALAQLRRMLGAEPAGR